MPQCGAHPWLKAFPYPVQKLIVNEIDQAYSLLSDIHERDFKHADAANLSCTCVFFLAYQVPCRHLIAHQLTLPIFTEAAVEQWVYMWDDTGFEMYGRITADYFAGNLEGEIGAPSHSRLTMKEVCDLIREKYYEQEKLAAYLDSTTRVRYLNWWVKGLANITAKVWKANVEDWLLEHELPSLHELITGSPPPWDGSLPISTPISTACRREKLLPAPSQEKGTAKGKAKAVEN
jgi:hypothetical protein